MIEIPTWLLWLIGAFIPIVTAAVGFTNAVFGRRTSRREEAMRLLRWSGEQAVKTDNPAAALMGIHALRGMTKGGLLDTDDKRLLWAITQAVLAPSAAEYSRGTGIPEIVVEDLEGQ